MLPIVPTAVQNMWERKRSAQHFTVNTAYLISVDMHSLVDECLSRLQFSPTILKFYNDSTRLNQKPIWPMTPQLKGHLLFNCVHFNHYRLQGMFTWFKVEVPLQAEKVTLTKNLSFLLTSVQRKTRFQSKQNLQGRPDGPCSQCQYKGLDVRLADKSAHCSMRL